MANTEKKEITTGLENATNRKEEEFDLLKNLLEAAEYATADDNIVQVKVMRNGKLLFPVKMRPLGDAELRAARKKATVYMKNPQGKNLPPIEKDFNNVKFKSLVIYAATTEDDQALVWGNKTIMDKFNLMEPYESVDILLTAGDKTKLFDKAIEIAGLGDDEEGEEVTMEDFRPESD